MDGSSPPGGGYPFGGVFSMQSSSVALAPASFPVREQRVLRAPHLAVIIPTFNEAENVPTLIEALGDALAGMDWEAIVVDDWSTDGTADVVAELSRRAPHVRLIRRFGRRGLSSAVVEGILAAQAPVCVVIDADLQHDERIVPELYEAVASGRADVAVGSRYSGGGSIGSWTAGRARVSSFATAIVRRLGLAEVSDPMSGFFAVRQSTVVEAAPHLASVGFKILLDLLVSSPGKLEVAEIPYRFRSRLAGESKLDSTVAFEFGMLLLEKLVGRWIPPRLILFGAVGSFGVLLHLAILKLSMAAGAVFSLAQTAAVILTIAANFFLNNLLTYRDRRLRGLGLVKGLGSFYLVCGLGAVANVGVGSVVFENNHVWWLAGLAGAAVGSLWNYMASAAVTWKRR